MFLLYADESGTPGGADQEHFILAGVTVFERKHTGFLHWIKLQLNSIHKILTLLNCMELQCLQEESHGEKCLKKTD